MKKIILIGYMSSGKSTIGKLLSKNLSVPFFDLDDIIEKYADNTVKEIFSEKGEIYFRKLESQLLHEFINKQNEFVLALGGGTPCYANNHLILQNEGISSFYLKVALEELVKRLEVGKETRPLVANLSEADLEDYVRKHLFDRNYYYYQAKSVINVGNKTEKEIVMEISKALA